jgi:hypothetical protein
VGASGVGKTTLAKYVADNYGLKLLPSASRAAIAEMGLSDYKTLMADPDLYHQFGLRVQKLQHEMEDVCIKNGEPFVSDRGFDHIAYAVLYQSYPKPFIEEGLKRLEQVKDRRIYIHVLPDAEVRECALEQRGSSQVSPCVEGSDGHSVSLDDGGSRLVRRRVTFSSDLQDTVPVFGRPHGEAAHGEGFNVVSLRHREIDHSVTRKIHQEQGRPRDVVHPRQRLDQLLRQE